MAFQDDELVQDFLVEAGEILEKLGEQLVELEHRPDDKELLNAVFRGFHTIKGGASFINLTALVEVCHAAEDVFNLLRNGQKRVSATLMDVMLRVLDVVNIMFAQVREGREPDAADRQLVDQIHALASNEPEPTPAPAAAPVAAPASPVDVAPAVEPVAEVNKGDITDEEFEQLLHTLEAKDKAVNAAPVASAAPAPAKSPTPVAAKADSDEISEQEFDQLLDELHGKGKAVGGQKEAVKKTAPDEITEAEFDQLLDELHGKGKFKTPAVPATVAKTSPPSTAPAATAPAAPTSTPVAAPAPALEKDESKTAAKASSSEPQGETTVRVDTKRLDDIMNMVGELVLARNRLVTLQNTLALGNEEFAQAIGNLDLVTADLQTAVMKTRMQPIKKVFGRFPRVVRDLARSLNKEVNLVLQGEETDLDKNLVEALADPLVHLVRNAVDHGIETPAEREKKGKSRAGTVVLSAEQEGDHILLMINDDGAGIDPAKLKKKAIEKGLIDADAAARMDARDAFNLIFLPGFSTKDQITDISGRGVGMDVVKTRIVQLNGTVEIDSKLGEGSRFSIKVPLTLAIMPTLMVMLSKQIFALPLVSVSEIFNLDLSVTNKVDGQEVIMLRDRPLPIYYLSDWLESNGPKQTHPTSGHVVVVSIGNQRAGFVVETLIGQEEVVIKPLGALLQGTKGFAGATITGDGRIALILDVPSLMKAYARRH